MTERCWEIKMRMSDKPPTTRDEAIETLTKAVDLFFEDNGEFSIGCEDTIRGLVIQIESRFRCAIRYSFCLTRGSKRPSFWMIDSIEDSRQ